MSNHYTSRISAPVVRRGIDWLRGIQNEDGSYGAALTDLAAYYKSPLAFAETGRVDEGQQALAWIARNYLTPQGHLSGARLEVAETRHCDLYEDLWVAWGAFRLGRDDISHRMLDFTMQFFDPRTGGFSSSINVASPPMQDLRSTALGGLVNLIVRDVETAKAAGGFVSELLHIQPDLSRGFYLVRDDRGSIVTDYSPALGRYFVTSRGRQDSLYYALGFAVAFLAKLLEFTGEREYLRAAERYVKLYESYGRDALQHHYSGKLAWGSALLYRLTGRESYAKLATVIAQYVAGLQLPTGAWWIPALFPNPSTQPLALTIDRTAEYVLWLTYLGRELEGT